MRERASERESGEEKKKGKKKEARSPFGHGFQILLFKMIRKS